MDDMVLRAMARWPEVPDVFGWLSLDRRGLWRLRGDPITHRGAVEFIGRNYSRDEHGRWYFQNGPQRVFVALEYTPWVIAVDNEGGLCTHTGRPLGALEGALLDEEGNLLLAVNGSVGVVLDRDLTTLAARLVAADGGPAEEADLARVAAGECGGLALRWQGRSLPVTRIYRGEVPGRFGFDPEPSALG